MPEFVVLAVIAGLLVPLMTGPLGCFVVWRKMAYFGDALAHSALAGVAIGLVMSVNITAAVILFCMMMGSLLYLFERQPQLATDTLLGILSHTMLAVGLITVSVFSEGRVDLYSYLFGDILSVSKADLITIGAASLLIGGLLLAFWKPLLNITVHRELASIEGVSTARFQALLIMLMSLLVAVGMKVVGVLLITSMLIIPAATARKLSYSPERMVAFAIGLGMLSMISGIAISYQWDTPAGPSAVISASTLFLLSHLLPKFRSRLTAR